MPTPASLLRMTNELIFVMLGGLLIWVGLSNRFMFDPRKPAWLGLGVVLVYWGSRAWIKTQRAARTPDRMAARIGGASLALVALMMLRLLLVKLPRTGPSLPFKGGA